MLLFSGDISFHPRPDVVSLPGVALSSSSPDDLSSTIPSVSVPASDPGNSAPAAGGAEGQPVSVAGGSGDTDVGSPGGFTSSARDPSGSGPSTNACTEAGNYCTGGDNTVTLYRNPFPANAVSNALADFAINYGPLGVILRCRRGGSKSFN